jgi:hypothetical protein
MAKWKKIGLIYRPQFDGTWRDNSALTPTAIELSRERIRVFASFRDKDGVGRIGYVDVSAKNPQNILAISQSPVLDIGEPGMFDDNGVILGDVLRVGKKFYMYYIGFQLVQKAKFLAYTGLAVGNETADTFTRISSCPVMDRHDEGKLIRAVHSVIYEDDRFKIWYAVGNNWKRIRGVDFPQYDINYVESVDGLSFTSGVKVLRNELSNNEYRIGRPRVYKIAEDYVMNFTYGTTDGRYLAGQATSNDGINWERNDLAIGIYPSDEGWDSLHLIYPCILTTASGNTYMFYNGNDMGKYGFGCAEMVPE